MYIQVHIGWLEQDVTALFEHPLKVTPKEQAYANLSGKKTLVGRNSGERLLFVDHPRSKHVK